MAELEMLPLMMGMMGAQQGGGQAAPPAGQGVAPPMGDHTTAIIWIVGVLIILGIILAVVFLSGKCSKNVQACSKQITDCNCLDSNKCLNCSPGS